MSQTIVINSEFLGKTDDELGRKLMHKFLRTLWASDKKPDSVIFYHAGVKLLTDDSPILDAIEALNKAGVDLLACGTCVGVYDLEEKINIGRVSHMKEVVHTLLNSDSVITP
jgi:selenium metabolism protein YedF